jgi:hypothetical protein
MGRYPIVADIAERVGATFAAGVVSAWVSDVANWQDQFTAGSVRTYVGAGVLAAVTLLKAMGATWVSRRNGQATSASLAPQVQLQPTGDVVG